MDIEDDPPLQTLLTPDATPIGAFASSNQLPVQSSNQPILRETDIIPFRALPSSNDSTPVPTTPRNKNDNLPEIGVMQHGGIVLDNLHLNASGIAIAIGGTLAPLLEKEDKESAAIRIDESIGEKSELALLHKPPVDLDENNSGEEEQEVVDDKKGAEWDERRFHQETTNVFD